MLLRHEGLSLNHGHRHLEILACGDRETSCFRLCHTDCAVPRFFFDIADGGLIIDDEGTEYPDAHAARAAAIATLPDVARDVIGESKSREVIVLMRDESNRALFTASLTLSAKWLVATP